MANVQQINLSNTFRIVLCGALALAAAATSGCASKTLEAPENAKEVLEQKEYEDILQVQQIAFSGEYVRLPGPEPKAAPVPPADPAAAKAEAKK